MSDVSHGHWTVLSNGQSLKLQWTSELHAGSKGSRCFWLNITDYLLLVKRQVAGLFCGLVRPVSVVVLIRGANSSSHPTNVSSEWLYTLPYALQMGLVHWSFNQPLLYACKHALHRLITSGRGQVVVGLGLILGHMTKCLYMKSICTIVHCLHMYCV